MAPTASNSPPITIAPRDAGRDRLYRWAVPVQLHGAGADRLRARRSDVPDSRRLRHHARARIHGRRPRPLCPAWDGGGFPAGNQPLLRRRADGNRNCPIDGLRQPAHRHQRRHVHRHRLRRHVRTGPRNAFESQRQRQHRRSAAWAGARSISDGRFRLARADGAGDGWALRVPPAARLHHLRPRGSDGCWNQDEAWSNTCSSPSSPSSSS